MHVELRGDLQDAYLPVTETLPSALVIEADRGLRSAVVDVLERFCPCVAAPSNALHAFDVLTQAPPAVLVLGSPLPDLDAEAFARIARAISHGTTRILCLAASEASASAPSAQPARAV